jgi:hypothetical protein
MKVLLAIVLVPVVATIIVLALLRRAGGDS